MKNNNKLDLKGSLIEIKKEISNIKKELIPNGGGSLRDAVNNINIKLDEISDKVIKISVETELTSEVLGVARWTSDHEGKFIYVNRDFKEMVGLFDDKLCLNDSWIANAVCVEDRNTVKEEWNRAIDSISEFNHNFTVCNKNLNKEINVKSCGKPVFDKQNRLIGWVGVFLEEED